MKTPSCLLLAAAALVAGGCQSASTTASHTAQSNITVNFQDPDKFGDVAESFGGGPSQYYLEVLSKYLQETAARHLANGQTLTVTFTDIDLAGDFIPGRARLQDVRVIKPIFSPHMKFTFVLRDASGAVIREGERQIGDLGFQESATTFVGRDEPLFYDKQLLENWVDREFKS